MALQTDFEDFLKTWESIFGRDTSLSSYDRLWGFEDSDGMSFVRKWIEINADFHLEVVEDMVAKTFDSKDWKAVDSSGYSPLYQLALSVPSLIVKLDLFKNPNVLSSVCGPKGKRVTVLEAFFSSPNLAALGSPDHPILKYSHRIIKRGRYREIKDETLRRNSLIALVRNSLMGGWIIFENIGDLPDKCIPYVGRELLKYKPIAKKMISSKRMYDSLEVRWFDFWTDLSEIQPSLALALALKRIVALEDTIDDALG